MAKMTKKQKEFAALAPPFDKPTQADRIAGATGKAYGNGQRPSKMYGGGMAMRKRKFKCSFVNHSLYHQHSSSSTEAVMQPDLCHYT